MIHTNWNDSLVREREFADAANKIQLQMKCLNKNIRNGIEGKLQGLSGLLSCSRVRIMWDKYMLVGEIGECSNAYYNAYYYAYVLWSMPCDGTWTGNDFLLKELTFKWISIRILYIFLLCITFHDNILYTFLFCQLLIFSRVLLLLTLHVSIAET